MTEYGQGHPAPIEALIAQAPWKASTHVAPHEYVLQAWQPELYARISALIAQCGYVRQFRGRSYRYVDVGEHRYWTIGPVLNRALREASHASQ